jgi:hypothetical protein
MRPLTFTIENDAITEFLVANLLSKPNTKLTASTSDSRPSLCWSRRMHWASDLYARANFFDVFVGNFSDESRRL